MIFKIFVIWSFLDWNAHVGHGHGVLWAKAIPFVAGIWQKVVIIDVQKTLIQFNCALQVVYRVISCGGWILQVGKFSDPAWLIRLHGLLSGQYFIANNWPPGLISNYKMIWSYERGNFNTFVAQGTPYRVPTLLLTYSVEGKNGTSVIEAVNVKMPVVSISDTNTDFASIFVPIPASDDSLNATYLFAKLFREIILKGYTKEWLGFYQLVKYLIKTWDVCIVTETGIKPETQISLLRELTYWAFNNLKLNTASWLYYTPIDNLWTVGSTWWVAKKYDKNIFNTFLNIFSGNPKWHRKTHPRYILEPVLDLKWRIVWRFQWRIETIASNVWWLLWRWWYLKSRFLSHKHKLHKVISLFNPKCYQQAFIQYILWCWWSNLQSIKRYRIKLWRAKLFAKIQWVWRTLWWLKRYWRWWWAKSSRKRWNKSYYGIRNSWYWNQWSLRAKSGITWLNVGEGRVAVTWVVRHWSQLQQMMVQWLYSNRQQLLSECTQQSIRYLRLQRIRWWWSAKFHILEINRFWQQSQIRKNSYYGKPQRWTNKQQFEAQWQWGIDLKLHRENMQKLNMWWKKLQWLNKSFSKPAPITKDWLRDIWIALPIKLITWSRSQQARAQREWAREQRWQRVRQQWLIVWWKQRKKDKQLGKITLLKNPLQKITGWRNLKRVPSLPQRSGAGENMQHQQKAVAIVPVEERVPVKISQTMLVEHQQVKEVLIPWSRSQQLKAQRECAREHRWLKAQQQWFIAQQRLVDTDLQQQKMVLATKELEIEALKNVLSLPQQPEERHQEPVIGVLQTMSVENLQPISVKDLQTVPVKDPQTVLVKDLPSEGVEIKPSNILGSWSKSQQLKAQRKWAKEYRRLKKEREALQQPSIAK